MDTPTGLNERPVKREVAGFIGTMNFFDARVDGRDGNVLVVDAQALGRISLPIGDGPVPVPGQPVQVAIRPEKLTLSEAMPEGAANRIEGWVENAAYLGERSHFFVSIDGLESPVAVSAQNRARAAATTSAARPVWLSWDTDAMVLLNTD